MEARFLFIIGEGEERAVYTHFCRKLRDKKHQLKNCKAMVAGKAALVDSTAHLALCALEGQLHHRHAALEATLLAMIQAPPNQGGAPGRRRGAPSRRAEVTEGPPSS